MSWIFLALAGAFEIVWVLALKYTAGLTRLWPTLIAVVAMLASIGFLALAVKQLPLGTAYAVWTGIGAAGAVLLGIVLFGESFSPGRLVSIALIIAGIIGLKLTTPVA